MKPAKPAKHHWPRWVWTFSGFWHFSGFPRQFCKFSLVCLGCLAGFGTFSRFPRPFCVFRRVCLGGQPDFPDIPDFPDFPDPVGLGPYEGVGEDWGSCQHVWFRMFFTCFCLAIFGRQFLPAFRPANSLTGPMQGPWIFLRAFRPFKRGESTYHSYALPAYARQLRAHGQ